MTISGAAGNSGSRSGTPALGGASTPTAGTPVKEETNTAPKAPPAAGQSSISAPTSSQPPTPRETAAEQARDGRGRPDSNGSSRPPVSSQDSKPRGLLDRLGAAGGSTQPSNADVSPASQAYRLSCCVGIGADTGRTRRACSVGRIARRVQIAVEEEATGRREMVGIGGAENEITSACCSGPLEACNTCLSASELAKG